MKLNKPIVNPQTWAPGDAASVLVRTLPFSYNFFIFPVNLFFAPSTVLAYRDIPAVMAIIPKMRDIIKNAQLMRRTPL